MNERHYISSNNNLEAIEIIEAYDLPFDLGNVIKYVLRCGHKGDEQCAVRDLEKARDYIDYAIARLKRDIAEKSAQSDDYLKRMAAYYSEM